MSIAYIRAYVLSVAVTSVLWESAQMPLYTLWEKGTLANIIGDVLRCTAVNILIATLSLGAAVFLAGRERIAVGTPIATIFLTILFGVGYTAYSEWVNVYLKGTWAYSELMPIVPGLEIGLSPLVQWTALPSVGILFAELGRVRRHTRVNRYRSLRTADREHD